MMTSRERATAEGARRRLVATRQSSRLAGKIADPPLPLPSRQRPLRGNVAGPATTPGELPRLPGSLPGRGSGDELPVHDPGFGHSPHLGEETGSAPGFASDRGLEPSFHQKSPASEPGASRSILYQSDRSGFGDPGSKRGQGQRKLSGVLQPKLSGSQQAQRTEKNVQEGVQKLSIWGDFPHGQTNPGNLPVHRWSEKDPSRETEQPRVDSYVTKDFFVSTLNNLFHRLESVIDQNNIKTEEKIAHQSEVLNNLSLNQNAVIEMTSEFVAEIQNYFVKEVEPLNEHFDQIRNNLKEELSTLSFKGKEVKTIEQKINDLVADMDHIKKNQQLLNNKIDSIISSDKTLKSDPIVSSSSLLQENHSKSNENFIPAKSEQPDTSSPSIIDVDKEVRKQMLASIPKTSDWPTFSGEGEYDHKEFIEWIDTLKSDIDLHDRIIVSRLNLLFKNSANEWYKGLKNNFGLQNWDWWKNQIDLKFGNATWRRRVQKAFYTSRFDAVTTPVAPWVTKQYKRIKSIEPYLNTEQINIKLLDLCDGEVAYAVKCALDTTHADIGTLINVLQEIVDQTNLGKKPKNKFVPTITSSSDKPKIYSDKPKNYSEIKCNNCGLKGHIAKDCRIKKTVNIIDEQQENSHADIPEEESEFE